MIACLYLPYFAVTRYRLDYALPAPIPLILAGNRVGYACCVGERQCGVYRSQTEAKATEVCRNRIFAPAEFIGDAELLAPLLDAIRQEADRVEILPDPQFPNFLIEIPAETWPAQIEFARMLERTVRAISNQTPSIAIAPTPFSARTITMMVREG